MATERIRPATIVSSTHLAGPVTNLRDDVETPDGSWVVTNATTATVPLWTSTTESGDLRDWYYPNPVENGAGAKGGGEFNRGDSSVADATASQDYAHSGSWSTKLWATAKAANQSPANGAKLFRWEEQKTHTDLYYSAWVYFPQKYTVGSYASGAFFNWWQWKSDRGAGSEPFFIFDTQNRNGTGNMYAVLYWYGSVGEGPHQGENGDQTWASAVDLPVGEWIFMEARYYSPTDFSGAIQVWQNGVEIFNLTNVRTRYSDGDQQWALNSYGKGITPTDVVVYVDDCAISTARMGS